MSKSILNVAQEIAHLSLGGHLAPGRLIKVVDARPYSCGG